MVHHFPAAIAQGMDFEKGEDGRMTIADRSNLILSRRKVPPNPIALKKTPPSSRTREAHRRFSNALPASKSFQRARRHFPGPTWSASGRHTVSALLRAQNRHQQDWSAINRCTRRIVFDEQAVFGQVRLAVEQTLDSTLPFGGGDG